jgi:hypothetical protein
MWTTIKTMLKSKKFITALAAVAVWVGGKVGLNMSSDEVLGAVTPLWAYIIAQGVSDLKKPAEKLPAPEIKA